MLLKIFIRKGRSMALLKRFFGKKDLDIYAPLNGKAIPLESVSDPIFAGKVLGDGMAIEPDNDVLVSPVNGKVQMVSDTLHAIGICSDLGVELLLHIGIDTVQLNGMHFKADVKAGQKVTKGQKLIEFDSKVIVEKGYSLTTMIIVTNYDQYKMDKKEGLVQSGDLVIDMTSKDE